MNAGAYTLHRKFPNRPLYVVRDGINHPLFLHCCQQWHPVHFRPALRHLHALADGNVVEQEKCRVQLQHHWTSL